jgi:hypothetical protein
MRLFTFFRRTTMLLSFIVFLFSSTLSLAIWATSLSAQLTMAAAAHTAAMAKAVGREKAKARLKRMMVAVPILGTAAATGFEYYEYTVWQEGNPGKGAGDYGCEVAQTSAEVMDEVLAELPEGYQPPRNVIEGLIPECAERY